MPEQLSEYFGARLAAIREALGLKQSEIGDKLGCSNGAYSLYERNKRQPTLSVLLNLCAEFGVSIDYLLGCLSPFPDLFAERLTEVLKKRPGKSLDEFVSAFDMDAATAKLLISGSCFPNAKTLKNLCNYLDCPSDYLIGLSDTMESPSGIPVHIATTTVPRSIPDPFEDLTQEQRTAINAALKAFRKENEALNKADLASQQEA